MVVVRRRRRRLEETKDRDDMEDCDVAANQLTEAPQCLTDCPSSVFTVASGGVRAGLERSGQNYYGDYSVKRRAGNTGLAST